LAGHKPIPDAYPNELRTLGDHIRKRRLDLGLLQKDVAARVGCDTATITNWELNHTSPEIRFIPGIIAFLGYDPYDGPSGTLGERIIACRQRMGLSQKRFACQLGIDPTTVAGWERGEHQPSERLRARLQRILAHREEDQKY
jgi:transcriptional regulator with XRE-family HTH domain